MASSPSVVSRAAARGTLFSIGLRLLSFLCTQVTLRWVDPVALGKASIDLELAFGFILFLSREGFRLVLSKQWNLGLAYATRLLHAIVAIVMLIWLLLWRNAVVVQERTTINNQLSFDYQVSATLYCLAAGLEGWAEPRILKCLHELQLEHKVYAEGMATVTKTIVTVLALWVLDESYPVTSFGVAQIGYAVVYNVVLYLRMPKLGANSNNKTNKSQTSPMWSEIMNIDPMLRNQVILFTLQGIFKHALTEGDRILLVMMVAEGYDKGLYALASAYGGMAARLMFQPLEENARLLWSKLVMDGEDKKSLLQQSYTGLVKLVLYVGLVFGALGTNYTEILLQILGGTSRRPAAPVLSAFCIYTMAMALNGMTEAFWYASAASREQVGRLSLAHFAVGVLAYAFLAPWLVHRYGTVGLVAANVVSMALRSCYAIQFSSNYFEVSMMSVVKAILPHPIVMMGFVLTFLGTQWSRHEFLASESLLSYEEIRLSNPIWLKLAGQHIGMGVTCIVGVASLVVLLERPYFRSLKSLFREKKD